METGYTGPRNRLGDKAHRGCGRELWQQDHWHWAGEREAQVAVKRQCIRSQEEL